MNLWVIFITGLTTGGLTCLAVQGGLLATALNRPISASNTPSSQKRRKKQRKKNSIPTFQLTESPLPIVVFLAAKLGVYTLLGFLLGVLGSALQITPTAQGIIQLIVGIYMLLTALNMLHVHPIFRYFALQPPHAVTRLICNQAKSGELFTPALLGLMTVLIPCGTTQAMMALAVSTGNGFLGALIMFVFILGTSPTFLVLGMLASRIRGRFQPIFGAAVAVLIIVLGIVSIDGGLNLLGVPFAPSRVITSLLNGGSGGGIGMPVVAHLENGVQTVTINATGRGYVPNNVRAQSGKPIRLHLVTNQNYSCTNSFIIPRLGVRQFLPVSGDTVIDLPAQHTGDVLFNCGMGMYPGVITVTE